MKSNKVRQELMRELEKHANVSVACNNVGISRQTFYRWRKLDEKFSEQIDEAVDMGRRSVNDLAESKLVEKIKEGSLPAVKYWLGNNKPNYMKPRTRVVLANDLRSEEVEVDVPVSKKEPREIVGNQITFIDASGEGLN